MNQEAFRTMIQSLQAGGYRITPQRKAICRVLAQSEEHPSAQMIYDQLHSEDDTFSLATVYNTLDALEKLGGINSLGEIGDGDSVRYDADTEPHVNLACVQCHRIVDIPNRHVRGLAEEITASSGYTLLGARVLYYGVCPECQAGDREKEIQT
jgi:Fur family peroxide stress response transcriptional regulator